MASHAVDRGDAGRDRRRRLGGLAGARLLARPDRAGRRTDQLKANTLSLGSAVKVQDATLHGGGRQGRTCPSPSLNGRLFGGEFAASGSSRRAATAPSLPPGRPQGRQARRSSPRASPARRSPKVPFDLAFNVQGEGLSPPGVVAGLSGQGSLSLGAGILQSLSSASAARRRRHRRQEDHQGRQGRDRG